MNHGVFWLAPRGLPDPTEEEVTPMNVIQMTKQKTLTELVTEYRGHLDSCKTLEGKLDNARLKAGQTLAEMRRRVEAGEAGDSYKKNWWGWFHVNVRGRSRKDAEKLLALAKAEDPETAAEDAAQRNREHQATHRAKTAAYVSGTGTDDYGFPSDPPDDEADGPWYVAQVRRYKTTAPDWGLVVDRPAKTTPSKDFPGAYEQEDYPTKFPTHAEALAHCAELQAKETDERFSYIPFSQWKEDATARTCGIRPWTTREEDEASIEASDAMHYGDTDEDKLENFAGAIGQIMMACRQLAYQAEAVPDMTPELAGDCLTRINTAKRMLTMVEAKITAKMADRPSKPVVARLSERRSSI